MDELPKSYVHTDIEKKWQQFWHDQGTYKWNNDRPREETFSVDTPPPTVSGSLHVGHVFSYTQTDVLARYQRMLGKNVFYPMGWDDNGLPTERRVQNVFGISCNPHLPYQPDWYPEKTTEKKPFTDISRQNFIEACNTLTQEDEAVFESMWRQLGISVDWNLQYATINDHCRKLSQASFLDLVKKDFVYQNEAPTMWDVDFKTAVAQAEIEDRVCPGAYHHIRFAVESGGHFDIATTRPELLAACIAVVAHPDDNRYKPLFGKKAITPLFSAPVPILASPHADPEKGSGILMVCTFGDAMDVEWWKKSGLPIKQILGLNGRLMDVPFGQAPFHSLDVQKASVFYDQIKGLKTHQARKKIAELLQQEGVLIKDPEPIEHPVKFYEKGDTPIEFMPTRQWFIKILASKAQLLAQGEQIVWHPDFMKTRYTNWVEGLNQDWCISRQRFFGVPFPVWYPLSKNGEIHYDAPIFATADQLPIDPLTVAPKGYTESQRNQPNGFCGDPDVMDTWATSSLTPQLMSHWTLDEKRHESVFPMDIRPQSHEIIRTWAFYTIAKAWMHHNTIPWKNVLISGWVLDPDRKKMSKSKGNVVTPGHLLESYSSDAVRYWASRARLGSDTAFDESVFLIGKKLVTKLFNASKFVMLQLHGAEQFEPMDISLVSECVDKAWIDVMKDTITQATQAFEAFEYAEALEKTEATFWKFCDHYIELVKGRAYQENGAKKESALASLDWSLKAFLRLLAPFLPYISEEIWSWRYTKVSGSVHTAAWPTKDELEEVVFPSWSGDVILQPVIDILSELRGAKTKAQKSMKHPISQLELSCPESVSQFLDMYPEILDDIKRAGVVETIIVSDDTSDEKLKVEVSLGG
jgi:valyl-tRNA synthetase